MIFLLLSISCSTIIFILFKLFGKYQVDNLQAIVANYIIAGTLGWFPLHSAFQFSEELPQWGVWPWVIGVMFITLFQLMANVTQAYGVNVVSVTVKMSVAIPILSGILLFSEVISPLNILGILLAFFAVYAINHPGKGSQRNTGNWLGLVVLFTGSGLLDAFLKVIQSEVVEEAYLSYFTSTAFGIAGVLGFAYILFQVYIQKTAQWIWKSWIWGLILGVPNYGSIYFLMKAIDNPYPSAVLFPINNVGIVGLSAVLALFLFKERITKWRLAGLIIATTAILMMSR